MLPAEIEKPLSMIELQCEALAAAVISGEPQALEAASRTFKQVATDFSALLEQTGGAAGAGPELRARLKKVTQLLTSQRENLIRRTVVVERALQIMMPGSRKDTYGQPAAPYAGAAGRAVAGYRGVAS